MHRWDGYRTLIAFLCSLVGYRFGSWETLHFMKLRDFITRLEIDPKKLINYALDPENPVGGDKAIVFANRLGYTQANYQLLLQQIYAQAVDAEATPKFLDEHGQRYQVDLEIIGTKGQIAIVRTGWIMDY